MFSTVLFSRTLSPSPAHAAPLSLKRSFWGCMKTTDQSRRSNLAAELCPLPSMAVPPLIRLKCRSHSRLDEIEQIGVHLVLEGRPHPVRRALVDLQGRPLDDLGRQEGGGGDGHDLV